MFRECPTHRLSRLAVILFDSVFVLTCVHRLRHFVERQFGASLCVVLSPKYMLTICFRRVILTDTIRSMTITQSQSSLPNSLYSGLPSKTFWLVLSVISECQVHMSRCKRRTTLPKGKLHSRTQVQRSPMFDLYRIQKLTETIHLFQPLLGKSLVWKSVLGYKLTSEVSHLLASYHYHTLPQVLSFTNTSISKDKSIKLPT